MAVRASHRAVRAEKRELRFRVIKSVDVAPGLCAVAGFAAKRSAIGSLSRHFSAEFALMRILVARGAVAIFELKGKHFVCAARQARLVAIRASNCRVRAGKREACVAVFRDRVRGAVPIRHRVAVLTPVLIGRRNKLIVMRILVAVRARLELHLVNRILARRCVALGALDFSVLALQRVLRRVVFLYAE